jgi:hypothetical protein
MTVRYNTYTQPSQNEALTDLVGRYEQELSQNVEQHDAAAVISHNTYTRQIDELSAGSFSEARLRKVVDGRDKKLEQQFAKDRAGVADVMARYGSGVERALSPSDRQVLARARAHAQKYGVGDYGLADILQEAPFMERQAIKVAMDREVQAQAEALARKHGVDDYAVAEVLAHASSFQARAAIKSMLDGYALAEAQKLTQKYGAGDHTVGDVLGTLSHNIRSVIKTTLDSDTLSRAQRAARKYGVDDHETKDIIGKASSWAVQGLIKTYLKGQETDSSARANTSSKAEEAYSADFTEGAGAYNLFKGFFKKRFGRKPKEEPTSGQQGSAYGDPFASYRGQAKAGSGPAGGYYSFRDFFTENPYAGASNRGSQQTGSQSAGARGARAGYQESPKTESKQGWRQEPKAEPRAEAEKPKFARDDPEVGPIVQAAVDRDRNRRWLLEAPADDVRRVITTIQALRDKADKPEDMISDRKIYLKYRAAIEIGEGDKDRQVDPRLETSFRIVDALMGGPGGKLPNLPKPNKT